MEEINRIVFCLLLFYCSREVLAANTEAEDKSNVAASNNKLDASMPGLHEENKMKSGTALQSPISDAISMLDRKNNHIKSRKLKDSEDNKVHEMKSGNVKQLLNDYHSQIRVSPDREISEDNGKTEVEVGNLQKSANIAPVPVPVFADAKEHATNPGKHPLQGKDSITTTARGSISGIPLTKLSKNDGKVKEHQISSSTNLGDLENQDDLSKDSENAQNPEAEVFKDLVNNHGSAENENVQNPETGFFKGLDNNPGNLNNEKVQNSEGDVLKDFANNPGNPDNEKVQNTKADVLKDLANNPGNLNNEKVQNTKADVLKDLANNPGNPDNEKVLKTKILKDLDNNPESPDLSESVKLNQDIKQNAEGSAGFSCEELPESTPIPTSVHHLRPSDIKVIGAMGDSLTAGTGITAQTILEELTQNRGMSWSGGGQGTLKEHLTMPNILKKFSPKLYGFATGDGNADSNKAHFNVAAVGSTSGGLLRQARKLVERMKEDPSIDFVNDWKVITVLSGNNDLCDYCHQPKKYDDTQYYLNLIRALDILHDELPRTLVNLAEPVDMSIITELNKGFVCSALHAVACDCAAFPADEEAEQTLQRMTSQFGRTVEEIALSGRYDTRQDFTVVYQPLFDNSSILPRLPDGQPDASYFSPDCFHLSQKGQEAAAIMLWNNMISPVPEKSSYFHPGNEVLCPNETMPYIFTNRNSFPDPPPSPTPQPVIQVSGLPQELFILVTVCTVCVTVIGAAVLTKAIQRVRRRHLYVQIPQ